MYIFSKNTKLSFNQNNILSRRNRILKNCIEFLRYYIIIIHVAFYIFQYTQYYSYYCYRYVFWGLCPLSFDVISAPKVCGPVGPGPARSIVETLQRHDRLFGRPTSGVVVLGRRPGIRALRLRVHADPDQDRRRHWLIWRR